MQAAEQSSQNVPVLGRGLHYLERGSGAPVLLVHGLGAGSHVWTRLALPGHRLLAVDLPGCGGSQPREGPLGPRELAGLLGKFMETVAPGERYAVIGHSFGSLVGAELALADPARVRALGLIDAPARLPRLSRLPALPLVGEALFGLSARAPARRTAVRLYLSLLFGDRRRLSAPIVERYCRSAEAPGYFEALLTCLRGLTAWDGEKRLGELALPTAVVWGEQDRLCPLADGRRLAESIPDASFHCIPGCGHSPPEEAPDELSVLLAALLRRAGSQA